MPADTDDKRFEESYRGVSRTTTKKQKEENETHVEEIELCQREHTRWHVDEAVLVELREKRPEFMRFDTRNVLFGRFTLSVFSVVACLRGPTTRTRLR
jgi:hypothetical protein